MLSGEGNENCEKTIIGLISKKKNFARAAHFFGTFLCRCFARLRETSRNFLVTRFMEEMSYMFLFTFFHCCLFFLRWVLAFRIFSPPLQIRVVLLLISRSCSPSLFSSLGFAGLSPFFSCSLSFRSLCIPNLWACQLI